MSAVLAPPFTQPSSDATTLANDIFRLAREQLLPEVVNIDVKGVYPESFLRRVGDAGLFAAHVPKAMGGLGLGLDGLVQSIESVSRVCGATGFLMWCQSALTWYLVHTRNNALRERLLPAVSRAQTLGGTGLSNLMKSCSGIEDLRLSARRADDGYVVNGALPWVSNLGPEHWFAVGLRVEGGGTAVAAVHGGQTGLSLVHGAQFTALEGTRTLACQFREVFVPDAQLLAAPGDFDHFISRIKPGFIIAQCGMALGIVHDCVDIMRQANATHAHVNRFLDDQVDELAGEFALARASILDLAARITAGAAHFKITEVLQARIDGSTLALRAATAAVLHAGAKGYLMRHPAQRRVREAFFVAIVTPAIKHLRTELANLRAPAAAQ